MACVTSTFSHVSLILEWVTVSHETKDPAKASCRNVFRSFFGRETHVSVPKRAIGSPQRRHDRRHHFHELEIALNKTSSPFNISTCFDTLPLGRPSPDIRHPRTWKSFEVDLPKPCALGKRQAASTHKTFSEKKNEQNK